MKTQKINDHINELINRNKHFHNTVFNDIFNNHDMYLQKYNKNISFTYDIFEKKDKLINLVIKRVNPNLVFHDAKKIYFIHPFIKNYCSDIHGNVYKLHNFFPSTIHPFKNILILHVKFNKKLLY